MSANKTELYPDHATGVFSLSKINYAPTYVRVISPAKTEGLNVKVNFCRRSTCVSNVVCILVFQMSYSSVFGHFPYSNILWASTILKLQTHFCYPLHYRARILTLKIIYYF